MGVHLGDCVVKKGFQLVTGSVFGNVDMWEIPVEAVVSLIFPGLMGMNHT